MCEAALWVIAVAILVSWVSWFRAMSLRVGVGDTAVHTELFWASAGCSRERQTLGVTRVGVSHFLNDSPHQVSVPAA